MEQGGKKKETRRTPGTELTVFLLCVYLKAWGECLYVVFALLIWQRLLLKETHRNCHSGQRSTFPRETLRFSGTENNTSATLANKG